MRALAWIALAATVSCAGAEPAVKRAGGVRVAACDADAYFVFDATDVRLRDVTGKELGRFAVPPDAGLPVMTTQDPLGQWSCAVYERRVALLAALRDAPPTWTPCDVGAVVSAAIANERLTVVGRNAVKVLRVPSAEPIWEGRPTQGLTHLHHAHPLSDSVVLLVGTIDGGLMRDSQVVLRRADRARGDWVITDTVVPRLSWVGACASAGEHIYVAGTWEDSRPVAGAGNKQRPLLLNIVVACVHAATLRVHEIVDTPVHSFESRVTDAAAGEDLLALVVDQHELQVYRSLESQPAVAPIYHRTFPDPIAITWLARRRIAVLTSGRVEIIDLP